MDVFEFIREKKGDLQENTAQFKAMIEPKFRLISEKINSKITNTLNNPWIEGFNPFEKSYLFSSRKKVIHPNVDQVYKNLKKNIGKQNFVGNWEIIDQTSINKFADITGDNQWIHTDPLRANNESPFKTTIAHGFLTLAMIPKLTETINSKNSHYENARMVVNYGLNQVRFPFPVRSGSRVRARKKLIKLIPRKSSIEVIDEVSIEVENKKRLACVAETVLRIYFYTLI